MFTSKRLPFFGVLAVVFWFCGVYAACPLGDLTKDGTVNAADLRALAGAWLTSAAGPADLNGDSQIDMADFGVLGDNWLQAGEAVIINELHTNPDIKTELVEFVELYNPGPADVDLSGWYFSDGIFYTFPAGATLPTGGYVIVVQDLNHVEAKWGTGRFGIPEEAIFGPYGGKLSNEGERIVLCNAEGLVVDEVAYRLGFPWPTVGDPVPENARGAGCSMQLVNPAFDNDLGGSWRSGFPSPAAENLAVFAENIAPQIRQVRHSPKQPRSGQTVTITAKVTDPDGVESVRLMYQPVNPGSYIALDDGQYQALWYVEEMHDDGLDGDASAGDDVFTFELPAALQTHRRLMRYKILVVDSLGHNAVVPYPDDPQPNFAYFVYDGVPGWSGAARPGVTELVEYPAEVMRSLPVYHMIADKQDVADAFYMPGARQGQYWGSDYPWRCTLVYNGDVYDHVRFRARGGVWRYSMGKNMPKFDFLRGHFFQAHDDYGREYDTTWDKLNLSACIQQGDYQHRGEHGMFEAASFLLFNLMGCEASKTNWLQLRVIDEADEFGPTQYDGDFWGLYMTIEQMDGRFLNEHGLPDGNLYKMEGGSGDLNNQGPTHVTDKSDLNAFMGGYRSRPPESWWRRNVNLPGYYGYRCVVEGVHHGDIGYGKNWFFYLHPETDRWSMLPWDLDLTWANNMYGNGEDDFKQDGRIFSNDNILIEYQNRLREFHDLLYNADQAYQMLDDLADIIDPPTGGPTMVDADRAMWDYNPIMVSGYVRSSKAGQGRFYQRAATKDFRGMVQIMKDYVVSSNREFDTYFEDPQIPGTPAISATCPPDFPINALTFHTSDFSDPQGAQTFAGMKWRIAEVAPGSQVVRPDGPSGAMLVPDGVQWKYVKGLQEPPGAWREPDFDDSGWSAGSTAIGYGESFIATNLGDMRGNYSTVYLRKTFDVITLDAFDTLLLDVKYDDGVVVWINGELAYQDNVATPEMPHDGTARSAIEDTSFIRVPLGDARQFLVDGTNVIAVQVLNASLGGSSDCFLDLRLVGEATPDDDGQTPDVPLVYRREPGKYEIEAVWESPEQTEFNSEVTIPGSTLRPGRTYRVRCRMKDSTGRWSHWSDPVQFVAGEPLAAGILADLRITEVMYNPLELLPGGDIDNDDYEFIELKNVGDETLDLSSVSFTDGIVFAFADGGVVSLGPGEFVLVVRNREAFESRYGSALSPRIAGAYEGRLANGGETVKLEDFWNGTIAEFSYSDGRGWPLAADGGGHSLVPLTTALRDEPAGSLNYAGNWRASTYMGGSPGMDDPQAETLLVLNEFLANTTGSDDWIELYNPTEAGVSLRHWYLSDDVATPDKWAFPALTIPAQGYAAFDEDDGFGQGATGFGLSRSGDELVLSYLPGTEQDRIADVVRFKAQEEGISLGRYPDGGPYWLRLTPSLEAANAGPIADVVIAELMYHPADANEEYVELYNPTGEAVALAGPQGSWRLDGAVAYTFEAGVSLPAGGRLVVVGFDPTVETGRLAAFEAAYGGAGLTPGVDLVGPWEGNLSNRGERLSLEKPDGDPPAWAIVDEVLYSDVTPWPAGTDGQGAALGRLHTDDPHPGNDPANWKAVTPSPGAANP